MFKRLKEKYKKWEEKVEKELNIPDHYKDPIYYHVMTNPVMTEHNQTYDKQSIAAWFEKNDTDPLTNLKIENKSLKPNLELKKEIKTWRNNLTFKKRLLLILLEADMSELFNKLNPFDIVRYQGNNLSHSRTLHTGILEKFADTFAVIHGSHNRYALWKLSLLSRANLFDFATLGIFAGIQALTVMYYIAMQKVLMLTPSSNQSFLKNAGIVLLWISTFLAGYAILIPHFIGNGIIRPVTSFAATALFSPFVLLAEAISKSFVKYKERKFCETTEVISESEDSTTTLYKALNGRRLRDCEITFNEDENNPNNDVVSFTTMQENTLETYVAVKFPDETKKELMRINFDFRKEVLGKSEITECLPRPR